MTSTNLTHCKKCGKIMPAGIVQDCPRCGAKPQVIQPVAVKKAKEVKKSKISISIGGDPATSKNVYIPTSKRKQ